MRLCSPLDSVSPATASCLTVRWTPYLESVKQLALPQATSRNASIGLSARCVWLHNARSDDLIVKVTGHIQSILVNAVASSLFAWRAVCSIC